MSKRLTRTEAMKGTRLAQVVGVVCVAGALAVAAVGLPGVSAPPPVKAIELPDLSHEGAKDATGGQEKRRLNGAALASRLEMVSNRPRVPVVEPPVVETGNEDVPVVDVPPATEANIKYLGAVSLGVRRLALLTLEDRQSFVAVGGKIGEHTLDVIETEWVRLTLGGKEKIVTLSPKGEQVVTKASGASAGAGGRVNQPGNAARQGSQARPTAAQILAQRNSAPRSAVSQATPVTMSSPFPDPARSQRYQQFREKLMSSGEYSTEQEVNEAAIKLTEQEYVEGLIPGANPKGVK